MPEELYELKAGSKKWMEGGGGGGGGGKANKPYLIKLFVTSGMKTYSLYR
jgi:hypothetical protein